MTPSHSANLSDPGRTRTYNPRLRRPMPYPLGHGAFWWRAAEIGILTQLFAVVTESLP